MDGSLETLTTAEGVVDRVAALVADADDEVALAAPPGVIEAVGGRLARTVDDGALVLVLATGFDPVGADDLADRTTLARRWEGHAPLTCVADGERGVFAPAPFIAGERTDRPATAFADPSLAGALFDGLLGTYWAYGAEVHAADPAPLGRPYTNFRHAVVQATLHLRERERVGAQVVGRPTAGADTETVAGDVVNARQSFVDPATSSFTVETSLVVDTGDGRVTVGGWGAFLEDYEAELVTLRQPHSSGSANP